jgi:hypothetical protein
VLGAQAAQLIRAGRIREGARIAYQAGVSRLIEEGCCAATTPRRHVNRCARCRAVTGASVPSPR